MNSKSISIKPRASLQPRKRNRTIEFDKTWEPKGLEQSERLKSHALYVSETGTRNGKSLLGV